MNYFDVKQISYVSEGCGKANKRAAIWKVGRYRTHPTNNPSPLPEDIAVTRKIVEAGRLMSIEVWDQIIIGQYCFVSLKKKGYGFDSI